MAEVDTSSYPTQKAPPKSPVEQATDYGRLASTIETVKQQKIGVDQKKLDLVRDQWNELSRSLTPLALKPNLTQQDIQDNVNMQVKKGLMQPNQAAAYMASIPPNATPEQLQNKVRDTVIQGDTIVNGLHHVYGQPVNQDNGQVVQPGVQGTFTGGFRPQGPGIQRQLPPGTETAGINPQTGQPDVNLPPRLLGAQGVPMQTVPPPGGRLPVAPAAAPAAPMTPGASALPVAPPAGTVPVPTTSYTQANPQGVPTAKGPYTGYAPGAAEAAKVVGGASGGQLASELAASGKYQREILPLQQAIPALEKLGTKGTGPGTETLNNIKSFLLSNLPGIKETDPGFASVPTYDKAKKYLIDYANQVGSTGTNDKLAATFAGNPSVGISNAAAVDVAKTALAARNMQQASIVEFNKTGLPPNEYAKWASNWADTHDPRGFGLNLLTPEAAKKLKTELNKPGHEKEKENVNNAYEVAKRHGYLAPVGQ